MEFSERQTLSKNLNLRENIRCEFENQGKYVRGFGVWVEKNPGFI